MDSAVSIYCATKIKAQKFVPFPLRPTSLRSPSRIINNDAKPPTQFILGTSKLILFKPRNNWIKTPLTNSHFPTNYNNISTFSKRLKSQRTGNCNKSKLDLFMDQILMLKELLSFHPKKMRYSPYNLKQ